MMKIIPERRRAH